MGHEVAGYVLAIGEGVDPSLRGRTVAVNPIVSCRRCRYCDSGARNLCRRKGLVGIARPGGFAELFTVPASSLVALPDGTDPRLGAFVEPMANGVHAARLGTEGREGASVVVIGVGAIGLCALQALRALGAGPIDVVEPDEGRRGAASRLGATRAHPSAATVREALGILEGARHDGDGGAEVVIDAVGTAATRQLAADLARPRGRVVLVGLHDDESTLAFRPIVRDEVVLVGSYAYTDDDFSRSARLLAAGAVGPGHIDPAHPLTEGPEIFARLAAGSTGPVRTFLGNG
jgi:threonine dehydrogenase-like Zn-dependent dehydrogenase